MGARDVLLLVRNLVITRKLMLVMLVVVVSLYKALYHYHVVQKPQRSPYILPCVVLHRSRSLGFVIDHAIQRQARATAWPAIVEQARGNGGVRKIHEQVRLDPYIWSVAIFCERNRRLHRL